MLHKTIFYPGKISSHRKFERKTLQFQINTSFSSNIFWVTEDCSVCLNHSLYTFAFVVYNECLLTPAN